MKHPGSAQGASKQSGQFAGYGFCQGRTAENSKSMRLVQARRECGIEVRQQ